VCLSNNITTATINNREKEEKERERAAIPVQITLVPFFYIAPGRSWNVFPAAERTKTNKLNKQQPK
jgi:hypothetical protein